MTIEFLDDKYGVQLKNVRVHDGEFVYIPRVKETVRILDRVYVVKDVSSYFDEFTAVPNVRITLGLR